MQELEQMINIYHVAFIVSLILTILFLVVSVVFFFVFDIRGIFDMRTGRGAKKRIQEMKELNDQTGRLRQDVALNTPVNLPPEERISAPVTEKRKNGSQQQNVSIKSPVSSGNAQGSQKMAADAEGSQKTTLLKDLGAQETTLLPDQGTQETTLLSDQGENGVTSPSGQGAQETMTPLEQSEDGTGAPADENETTVLTPHQEESMQGKQKTLPGAFQIEKEILWVHTDEIL